MRNTRSLMLRRQHIARIAQDPVDLVLVRRTKAPDGAGGFTLGVNNLPPQRVRVTPFRQGSGRSEVNTNVARTVNEDWVLMGLPGMDVNVHDEFTLRGNQWEITSSLENSPERVLMGVVNRGPATNAS